MIRSFALGEAVRAIGATELRSVCAALIALACLVGVLSRRRTGRPSPLLSPGARAAWIAMPLVPAAMLLADQLRDTHTFFLSRQSFALLPLLLLLLLRVHLGGGDAWLRRFSTGCLVAWLALLSAASLANIVTRAQTDTALESVAKIVARSDEPATLLVLSGAAPGYVIPLLLTLRDEGVSQLRVRYAHGDGLYRLVEDRIRREGGGALRLVNFAGRYGAEGRWSEALLADVERRAVAVGWEVRTASPGSSLGTRGESAPGWMLESLGTPGPQLVILTPVGVKSFDP